MPKDKWPQDSLLLHDIDKSWCEPYGDRRQELVFIGMRMDKEWMITQLDSCLIKSSESLLAEAGSQEFCDPFPQWNVQLLSDFAHDALQTAVAMK